MSLVDLFLRSLEDVIEILDGILYSRPIVIIQLFSAVISALFLILWIRLLVKTETIKSKVGNVQKAFRSDNLSTKDVFSNLSRVDLKLQSNYVSDWKLAIIEADSILDQLIQALGYKGDTMGDRMKNIRPGQFPYLDEAWRVHKVRNFLAHDPNYELSRQAVLRTIDIYKKIFREFGME